MSTADTPNYSPALTSPGRHSSTVALPSKSNTKSGHMGCNRDLKLYFNYGDKISLFY
jgi:hypothetical protein